MDFETFQTYCGFCMAGDEVGSALCARVGSFYMTDMPPCTLGRCPARAALAARPDVTALEGVRRYDMVTNMRCGECCNELEIAEDGEWCMFADVLRALSKKEK